nr:hypothetical protein B0A51_02146 [Rachicladosporium sp. CCFEE 5018]
MTVDNTRQQDQGTSEHSGAHLKACLPREMRCCSAEAMDDLTAKISAHLAHAAYKLELAGLRECQRHVQAFAYGVVGHFHWQRAAYFADPHGDQDDHDDQSSGESLDLNLDPARDHVINALGLLQGAVRLFYVLSDETSKERAHALEGIMGWIRDAA